MNKKLKKNGFLLTGCLFLTIFLLGAGSCLGQNNVYQGKRIPGKIPKHIPKLVKRPDLVITRIYSKKHMGSLGVWADIKNVGGEIPKDQFQKADMRFYLTYLRDKPDFTSGPFTKGGNNGYALKYLDHTGILRNSGGMISAEAPGNLTCHGTVKVKVEVDLPVSGGGRIKESNEQNNTKTVILHCP